MAAQHQRHTFLTMDFFIPTRVITAVIFKQRPLSKLYYFRNIQMHRNKIFLFSSGQK
jgi:hypothetical protein